jgi:uncharacterized coiled-coil protein SlyX
MDIPLCTGCRERDARLAKLEAELAKQQQAMRRLEATVQRLAERLAQYEPEVRREGGARPSGSEKQQHQIRWRMAP